MGGGTVCAERFCERGLCGQFGQILPPVFFLGAVGDGHAPDTKLESGGGHCVCNRTDALAVCNLPEFGDRHVETAISETDGELDGFVKRDVDAQRSGAEVGKHGFLLT